MKTIKIILSSLAAVLTQAAVARAEDVTLVAKATYYINSYNQREWNQALSETITLNQGDTAICDFVACNDNNFNDVYVDYILDSKGSFSQRLNMHLSQNQDFVIAGPAAIKIRAAANWAVATFQINRAGLSSPPASIPQEAGTTWDVILESSSDLVNWTPTNPGEYSGTEPKRFFRTRMVKKNI